MRIYLTLLLMSLMQITFANDYNSEDDFENRIISFESQFYNAYVQAVQAASPFLCSDSSFIIFSMMPYNKVFNKPSFLILTSDNSIYLRYPYNNKKEGSKNNMTSLYAYKTKKILSDTEKFKFLLNTEVLDSIFNADNYSDRYIKTSKGYSSTPDLEGHYFYAYVRNGKFVSSAYSMLCYLTSLPQNNVYFMAILYSYIYAMLPLL